VTESIFASGLGPGTANFAPLTPLPTTATGKIQKVERRERVRAL